MLRLTDEARKVFEAAKASGLKLYPDKEYEDFLLGRRNIPTTPTFATEGNLDVLAPSRYSAYTGPLVTLDCVAPGEQVFIIQAYATRTKDEIPAYVSKFLPPVGKTWRISSGGIDLGVVVQAVPTVEFWLNGAKTVTQVPKSLSKAEREAFVQKVYGPVASDWYRFGDEDDYPVNPQALQHVRVRPKGEAGPGAIRSGIRLGHADDDLTKILTDGEYEYSFRVSRPVWHRLTVTKTETAYTLYVGSVGQASVPVVTNVGDSEETKYQKAVEALKAAGHRPVIALNGAILR